VISIFLNSGFGLQAVKISNEAAIQQARKKVIFILEEIVIYEQCCKEERQIAN
jgi:hypothetical protein